MSVDSTIFRGPIPPGQLIMDHVRVEQNSCWIWLAAKRRGYGAKYHAGRLWDAHRLSWTIFRGPIPPGLWVLHNCPAGDNPACVNPAHLWLGTTQDNTADCVAKGRARRGVMPGAANGRSILTSDQVETIRASTEPGSALARRFGVCPSTVYHIRRGRTWRE